MEGKSKGYQASSFVADLFDVKEPPLSSTSGVFAAIFSSPQKGRGRNSSSSGDWLKQTNGNQPRHTRQGNSGSLEPCHLSSSLYYGGQDGYSQAPSAGPSPPSPPTMKKSGGEDDPNGNNSQPASRGNWWQGSLYY